MIQNYLARYSQRQAGNSDVSRQGEIRNRKARFAASPTRLGERIQLSSGHCHHSGNQTRLLGMRSTKSELQQTSM
jgi:hypothetical protein